MTEQQPVLMPPEEEEIESTHTLVRPDDTMLAEFSGAGGDEEAVPNELPPASETEAAADESAAATWHNNKKVTALWSINQNRNVHIAIPTLGWKKLADNNDTCVMALNILAENAKLGNRTVHVREDSGKITDMYVW